MICKCGPRVLHHWAHKGRRNCDPWWESETAWHRDWKNQFPERCREIHHRAHDGEIHRADVRTPTGIYIEIQHSSMSDAERCAREDFYRNLLWIVDASTFRRSFRILHPLPSPKSLIAADIVWFRPRSNWTSNTPGLFYRLSETRQDHPEKFITKFTVQSLDIMVKVHSSTEIGDEIGKAYSGHHQYHWVRPRKTWLESPCPVFLDFGEEGLAKLESYDVYGLPCIRFVAKSGFVKEAMSNPVACSICDG